jgi:hypothetical protein
MLNSQSPGVWKCAQITKQYHILKLFPPSTFKYGYWETFNGPFPLQIFIKLNQIYLHFYLSETFFICTPVSTCFEFQVVLISNNPYFRKRVLLISNLWPVWCKAGGTFNNSYFDNSFWLCSTRIWIMYD